MSRERLVVIGGDAAGMSAASQARKRRDEDDLEIVAFERGRATSYSACGIPYWIGGAVDSEAELVARTPEQHRANGIDLRMRTEVVGIDLSARRVTARELETGREYDEPYDSLVYATGSVPMRPQADGFDAPGVHGVQVLDDGRALIAELDSGRVERVVVVGGGYIGLELAEACQVRGLDVTVVDRSATPIGTFDPDIGAFIADAVVELGIRLVLGQSAARVETGADGRAVAVHLTDGSACPPTWSCSGSACGRTSGWRRRPASRWDRPAASPSTTGCAPRWTACGRRGLRGEPAPAVRPADGRRPRHARQQAGPRRRHQPGRRLRDLPGRHRDAVTKVCDLEVARTGCRRRRPRPRATATSPRTSTRPPGRLLPGAKPIRVKLLAEKRSGRLLGGQIVGARAPPSASTCWPPRSGTR
jgi:NADPH-dependent 2,4-dienoyl-CoA reductase/sulfur reductase-like enzyme